MAAARPLSLSLTLSVSLETCLSLPGGSGGSLRHVSLGDRVHEDLAVSSLPWHLLNVLSSLHRPAWVGVGAGALPAQDLTMRKNFEPKALVSTKRREPERDSK